MLRLKILYKFSLVYLMYNRIKCIFAPRKRVRRTMVVHDHCRHLPRNLSRHCRIQEKKP